MALRSRATMAIAKRIAKAKSLQNLVLSIWLIPYLINCGVLKFTTSMLGKLDYATPIHQMKPFFLVVKDNYMLLLGMG